MTPQERAQIDELEAGRAAVDEGFKRGTLQPPSPVVPSAARRSYQGGPLGMPSTAGATNGGGLFNWLWDTGAAAVSGAQSIFAPSAPILPGNNQQGRLGERLDRLTTALESMVAKNDRQFDLKLESESGRPLSRATSRPRAIEQFYDAGPGVALA